MNNIIRFAIIVNLISTNVLKTFKMIIGTLTLMVNIILDKNFLGGYAQWF
jgi:hypothetical protein